MLQILPTHCELQFPMKWVLIAPVHLCSLLAFVYMFDMCLYWFWSCHWLVTPLCSPILCFALISLLTYALFMSCCEVLLLVLCSIVIFRFIVSVFPTCSFMTHTMDTDDDSLIFQNKYYTEFTHLCPASSNYMLQYITNSCLMPSVCEEGSGPITTLKWISSYL